MKPRSYSSFTRWLGRFGTGPRLAYLVVVVVLGFGGTGAAAADRRARQAQADELFRGPRIPRIRVEIAGADWEKLKTASWNPGMKSEERPQASATVREGDQVFTNVSVHLKGAAGSFRSVDDRPALTLNFEKNADGQYFHGLRKLSLNNSVQDPSYVNEIVCREMYSAAGIPVPRATHARVELNGRDLGVYVLVEGWDREFLRRHFIKSDGNLYDGGFLKDVSDVLSLNEGENPSDQSDRERLVKAASESDPARRQEALERILDVERFVSLMAMDVLTWNWDGYVMNKNNWRLYHDTARGRMVFMPHGLDQMFWKPEGPILPGMEGLVARAVFGVPDFRRRYFERLAALRRTVLDVPALTQRIRQLAQRIQPLLKEEGEGVLKEFDRSVEGLCAAIQQRAAFIDYRLSLPIEPVRFGADGYAALRGWKPRSVFGRAVLTQLSEPSVLQVLTTNGSSVACWRTSVWLEQGKYRFEARARVQGVVGDPGDTRPGVRVRAKDTPPKPGVLGDAESRELSCEVEVRDGLSEVELLCEFRGVAGEVRFDEASLRLRKLEAEKPAAP